MSIGNYSPRRSLARREGREWNTKKPLTWSRVVRYAARSGAEVTKLGMGGNQARMNKQYSGQSWRLPRPEQRARGRAGLWRLGRLDIGQRGLLARLVILVDAANYTDEAAICKTAVLPFASRIQAAFTITTSFPLAPERGLADSARHPLASFDKVFVCHADNRTMAAKQIPRRQPSRISDCPTTRRRPLPILSPAPLRTRLSEQRRDAPTRRLPDEKFQLP
jgi:hypothetical protein